MSKLQFATALLMMKMRKQNTRQYHAIAILSPLLRLQLSLHQPQFMLLHRTPLKAKQLPMQLPCRDLDGLIG